MFVGEPDPKQRRAGKPARPQVAFVFADAPHQLLLIDAQGSHLVQMDPLAAGGSGDQAALACLECRGGELRWRPVARPDVAQLRQFDRSHGNRVSRVNIAVIQSTPDSPLGQGSTGQATPAFTQFCRALFRGAPPPESGGVGAPAPFSSPNDPDETGQQHSVVWRGITVSFHFSTALSADMHRSKIGNDIAVILFRQNGGGQTADAPAMADYNEFQSLVSGLGSVPQVFAVVTPQSSVLSSGGGDTPSYFVSCFNRPGLVRSFGPNSLSLRLAPRPPMPSRVCVWIGDVEWDTDTFDRLPDLRFRLNMSLKQADQSGSHLASHSTAVLSSFGQMVAPYEFVGSAFSAALLEVTILSAAVGTADTSLLAYGQMTISATTDVNNRERELILYTDRSARKPLGTLTCFVSAHVRSARTVFTQAFVGPSMAKARAELQSWLSLAVDEVAVLAIETTMDVAPSSKKKTEYTATCWFRYQRPPPSLANRSAPLLSPAASPRLAAPLPPSHRKLSASASPSVPSRASASPPRAQLSGVDLAAERTCSQCGATGVPGAIVKMNTGESQWMCKPCVLQRLDAQGGSRAVLMRRRSTVDEPHSAPAAPPSSSGGESQSVRVSSAYSDIPTLSRAAPTVAAAAETAAAAGRSPPPGPPGRRGGRGRGGAPPGRGRGGRGRGGAGGGLPSPPPHRPAGPPPQPAKSAASGPAPPPPPVPPAAAAAVQLARHSPLDALDRLPTGVANWFDELWNDGGQLLTLANWHEQTAPGQALYTYLKSVPSGVWVGSEAGCNLSAFVAVGQATAGRLDDEVVAFCKEQVELMPPIGREVLQKTLAALQFSLESSAFESPTAAAHSWAPCLLLPHEKQQSTARQSTDTYMSDDGDDDDDDDDGNNAVTPRDAELRFSRTKWVLEKMIENYDEIFEL